MRLPAQYARVVRGAALVGCLCGTACAVLAQRGGGSPGGGGMPGGGPPMGGMSNGNTGFNHMRGGLSPGNSPDAVSTSSTVRGGLQVGPPGRWWDDKHFAKDLQLRPEQQRHMDVMFETNRAVLLKRYEDLQGEQSRMETLVHAKMLDESTLFAQIDRIAQARAELEKANTHLLLQLRGEMDGDQLARLEQHR